MKHHIYWHAALILATAPACAKISSEPAPIGQNRCDYINLESVFQAGKVAIGRRFCGRAVGYVDGLALKVFPKGRNPKNSASTVMFLDSPSTDQLRNGIAPGSKKIHFYVEGLIEGNAKCFSPDSGTSCVPYQRPFFLKVETLRIN